MESSEVAFVSSSSYNDDTLELSLEQRKGNSRILSRIVRQRNAFIITTVILIIAFLVLFIFFISKAAQSTSPLDSDICTSVACVKVSSELMSYMDVSVDPCDDFYNYACGSWEKENNMPDTESRWNQLIVLDIKNKNFLNKLINDEKIKMKYKDNEAIIKTFQFYDSCMNTTRISEIGVQPLLNLIEKLGSWNLSQSGSWNASSWNFIKTLVDAHHYSTSFFKVVVGSDYLNSTLNIIMLDQSGIELTKETYLQNSTDYAKVRTAYKKLMIQIVGLLGAKGDDAKRQMMDVYDLETKIANITVPVSVRRHFAENYNKITIKQLTDYTGNAINLKTLLQAIFKDYISITDESIVVVDNLDYLRNICQLFEKTPTTTVANYMMWRVVLQYLEVLPKNFKKIVQEFNEVKKGTKKQVQQWRQCLSSTSSIFGMPLGVMFIADKFTRETKLKVQDLIHEIREIFIKNLDDVDWMEESTKNVAKEKARVMLENIGYPDYITNKTALSEKLNGYEPSDDYFDNVVKGAAFLRKINLQRINEPADKKKWFLNPQDVNAYYTASNNKIGIPAGILQTPFFNEDRPRALNYGSIGVVVGHEITHGFDDNGRRFNKNGNLRKWWSNHSIDAFNKKTNCLIDQYSRYKMFGKSLRGDQTLGENIADNGALKQAYQAYRHLVKQKGHDRLLPGINTTNDQLFFLGFAQVWCGIYRRQAVLRHIENDYHTLGMYRVIGSISNSEDFSEAYQCAPGTKMNPKKKCHVW